MQYVTSTSFLLLTYAKYLKSARMVVNCGGTTVSPSTLRVIAKKQVQITQQKSISLIGFKITNYIYI